MASGEQLIVIRTLDQLETGQELTKIPPHATDLSWFVLSRLHIGDLAKTLDELAAEHGDRARTAMGRERVLYGVNEDIPACTLDDFTHAIHDGMMNSVDELGGEYLYEGYARNLSAHITDEMGVAVQPGDEVNFSSLVLLSRQDDERGKRKVVEHAITLGESL